MTKVITKDQPQKREKSVDPLPFLVSVKEAARLLGISKSAFYKLQASGRGPLPIKLGRSTRYRRAELEAWVDAGCGARQQ